MPAGLRFHRDGTIPAPLRGLPDGVHKVDVGDTRLHVLAGHDARGGWVMVDHESDYDKIELVVYSMFGIVFIGFLLLATLLGRFLGTRVVTPIRELAQAVGSATAPLALTARKDELGVLARALEEHTAHEAAECVTVLLLLARSPELGQLPPVAVDAIARDEVDKYRPLVDAKPVVMRFVDGPALAVCAPRELCAAAIGNLVRNACQYTGQGEVRISLLPGRVVVEDTGPGLPPAVIATLGSSAGGPSSGSSGTGLGLALARRICDFLDAGFAYEARAGGGSRFTITFHTALPPAKT